MKKNNYNNIIYFLDVYVIDILITRTNTKISKVKNSLQGKYKLNNLKQLILLEILKLQNLLIGTLFIKKDS